MTFDYLSFTFFLGSVGRNWSTLVEGLSSLRSQFSIDLYVAMHTNKSLMLKIIKQFLTLLYTYNDLKCSKLHTSGDVCQMLIGIVVESNQFAT